jgi:hypothetical protein
MKIYLLALITSAVAAMSCNVASTQQQPATDSTAASSRDSANNSGWQSLFDGKTTTGWHTYGKTTAGSAWKVADGTLYLDTAQKQGYQVAGGGDLVTDDVYENYDLKLNWKIAKNGNSGIIFNVNEDTAKYHETWNTGPEMQILDNNGHPDAKIPKHRAGDLYDLIACSRETVKPAMEWNEAEIVCNKGKLDLYLNGVDVVSTTMWDDDWKKMIAASKFKDMPGFGTYHPGRIALQDHGFMVWFRNIRIKKL